jgi:hypothetical protein
MRKAKGANLDAYADEPGGANASLQAEEADVRVHQNPAASQRKFQGHHA